LRKCIKLDKLRKALESLPKTLDDTYARILSKIDEEDNGKEAFTILQWLAYSARPLQLKEIVEVIAVDIGDDPRFEPENRLPEPRDILTICSSLVTIAESELRLAHFSVKEYLVSDRVPARYSIGKSAHGNIAQTCLTYLLHFEGSSLLTLDNIDKFPLARYAAKYWTKHARMAKIDTDRTNLLSIELLQSNRDAYINWVRLFDLDESWIDRPNMSKSSESIPSPLYYTSLEGLAEPARQLLEKGADVNVQGGRYSNALHAASVKGHDQIVQQLLEKGANVNAEGGYYHNALQAASVKGHSQVVQQLLEKGADVNAQGGHYSNALQAASVEGHDHIVQQLLEKGAHVNAEGGYYSNALQAASVKGHGQVVQQLLDKGADVNARGGHYGNALQAASVEGYDQIVKQLLKKGANVNAQGGRYRNALYTASALGYDQVVQQLLEKGADVRADGGDYRNALYVASAKGHSQVVQQLLEKGSDVNAQGGLYGNAL
jgi:ankyrin repeat protein